MIKFFAAVALISAALPAHAEILGYECNARILHDDGSAEKTFRFPAGAIGHDSIDQELDFKNERLEVAVNSQMLSIGWSRDGKMIAMSTMMFQRMTVPAYVLIVNDPENPARQATLDCSVIDSSNF